MSLLRQASIFQALAMNSHQLRELAKQALTDNGAWQVLTDQLLETGQIEVSDTDNKRLVRLQLVGQIRTWMIENFFSPIKDKLAKDVQIGDVAEHGMISDIQYRQERSPVSEMLLTWVKLTFEGKHIFSVPETEKLRIQEPPSDWDRGVVVKKLARVWNKLLTQVYAGTYNRIAEQATLFSKLAQQTAQEHQSDYYDDTSEVKYITDDMIIRTSKKFGLNIRLLNFIGQGRYSKVFLYKNRVVKFTLSHNDVNALLRLEALRDKLKSQKHLLKVYNVEHDEDTGLYLIEVEQLEPLDPHVRMMLFSAPRHRQLKYETPRKTFEVLKNGELIAKLLHMAWKDLPSRIQENLAPHKRRLFLLIIHHFASVGQKPQDIGYNLDHFIMKLIMDTVRVVADKVDAEYNYITEFMQRLHFPLARVLKERFPEDTEHSDVSPTSALQYSTMPESRSVMEFLNDLRRMGVNWRDLHGANLMQRPGTKDIVVSDSGLFEFHD